MPSITEEQQRMPKSPEDRPISGDGCCELCLYNIPRGSMMVILPGVILLLCGGLTLLVTRTTEPAGSWTSVTSMSILIVGAIITVLGFLFCTKMWCKYRPKQKKSSASRANGNDPVSLVAVYKIRQDGQDNRGFLPDSHMSQTSSGVIKQQPGGRSRETRPHDGHALPASSSDAARLPDGDLDLEAGDLAGPPPYQESAYAQYSLSGDTYQPEAAPSNSAASEAATTHISSNFSDSHPSPEKGPSEGADCVDGGGSDGGPESGDGDRAGAELALCPSEVEHETSFSHTEEVVFREDVQTPDTVTSLVA